MSLTQLFSILKGGPGSGNWGHAGIPGKKGGSAPKSGIGAAMSLRTGRDWQQRQAAKKNQEKILNPAVHGDDILVEQNYTAGLSTDGSFMDYGFLQYSSQVTSKVKDEIVNTLSAKTGLSYDAVNAAIRQWADTSNDTDMRSLSLQESASRVFGVELSDWQKGKIQSNKEREQQGEFSDDRGKEMFWQEDHYKPYRSPKAAQDAFTKAMYEHTQSEFRKAGIKNVTVYRGSTAAINGTPGEIIKIKGNALESWTIAQPITQVFGSNVISTTVPVERILGTARTGYGCLNEYEFVVIGGKGNDYAKVES